LALSVGTIVGAIAGSAGWGAAIGVAAGADGGYIYDNDCIQKKAGQTSPAYPIYSNLIN
jgi:hypothetical protein